ncbi:BPSS1187 family protein [Neorhodopirellula lusitana]|uniref:BPSS1187 family protein n=1 Tax=Neorhodopirellula lusitana TaxID=445327 RepID=UPI00384C0C50
MKFSCLRSITIAFLTGMFSVGLVTANDLAPLSKPPAADESKVSAPVRVLAVGNSFTGNATRFLEPLAKASGHDLSVQRLIIGGSPLELHAAKAKAFAADPNNPKGRYSNGKSLQEALQSEDFDFVTIQQVSIKSHDIRTYQPYASELADVIRRYSPGSQLLVHQTWAYRSDDPRFHGPAKRSGKSLPNSEPVDQAAMYHGLTDAYRTITKELGAKRIPVGDAFFFADTDEQFGFRGEKNVDPQAFTAPAVPASKYSLHAGWHWSGANGGRQLRMDGHHANQAGEYLGACVWYECLLGESVVGNSFHPAGMDAEYARFLQLTAHRAVSEADDAPKAVDSTDNAKVSGDPNPQRYRLSARASELDDRVKSHAEIGFVIEKAGKPEDVQHASVDTTVPLQGKLVIWLMAHNSALFERLNGYGLHAIQVSYAKQWFGKLCQPKPRDAYARGNVRLEAATGLDFSDELDLTVPDGAAERTRQMILWLSKENPQGEWSQFLSDDGKRVRWDKVIVAGSSHGSTTAARFAKHQRVDRVVMLCGPRDQDQDWQSLRSATPANRFFGFSHVLDGGWTGDHYCRSWEMLGLHEFGPIVNVDDSESPFGHSRRLISAADVGGNAGKAHSAVTPGRASPKNAEGEFLYESVWRYLFNHPVGQIGEAAPVDDGCLRDHVTY